MRTFVQRSLLCSLSMILVLFAGMVSAQGNPPEVFSPSGCIIVTVEEMECNQDGGTITCVIESITIIVCDQESPLED